MFIGSAGGSVVAVAAVLFAPWEASLDGPFIIPTSRSRTDGGDGSVGPTPTEYATLSIVNGLGICASLVRQPLTSASSGFISFSLAVLPCITDHIHTHTALPPSLSLTYIRTHAHLFCLACTVPPTNASTQLPKSLLGWHIRWFSRPPYGEHYILFSFRRFRMSSLSSRQSEWPASYV